jgi:CheY-like chemotaxis protein
MEKILIIEDDKSYIENIRTLLEEEDFSVLSASNGFDGIDIAKIEIPDLIICDIMLPILTVLIPKNSEEEKDKAHSITFLTAKEMTDLAQYNFKPMITLQKPSMQMIL